jgi:hypothetical protein
VPSRESALLRGQPGQPEASDLVRKLDGTHQEAWGSGVQMPMGDAALGGAAPDTIWR